MLGTHTRLWFHGYTVCVAALMCAACQGDVSCTDCPSGLSGAGPLDPGTPVDPNNPGQPMDCSKPAPGAAPVRRMTRAEYNNTVRDLLGDTTGPAQAFALEEEALGFNNNAANLVTSAALAEKYMLAAEGIAQRATAEGMNRIGCDPVELGAEACAQQFIQSFGKRAFRRPLTSDETTLFWGVFSTGLADGDFFSGIQMVIETALQSPPFLYRVELGVSPKAGEAAVRLSDWETASRLSYLLWGSMPDEALFIAAEQGRLTTREDIEAQARRMLLEPRAHDAVATFHEQWLDYDRIANVGKDAETFPEWNTELGALMREETRRFLDASVFGEGGGLSYLLGSSETFLDPTLAAFYGVPAPAKSGFARVTLDATRRAGVLTLGSLLTINAHSNQTSPVHRGKMVRELLLCETIPPPPADVMIKAPEPAPDSTARQRFAQHSSEQACKGCHALMDPLGFGFENYDATGRYRDSENGAPIDASGELTGTDVDGTFTGAVGLAAKLAASQRVQDCYATQWFRFAYGRGEGTGDACSLATLTSRLSSAKGDVKELLVALTQTDAFLYRPAGALP